MHPSHTEKIIRSFYDGVLDQGEWQNALENLRAITNSEQAALLFWDKRTDEVLVGDACVLDRSMIEDYERNYACIDPIKEEIDRFAIGDWYVDTRDMGVNAIRRSDFYQEFMRRHDLRSVICSRLFREGHIQASLSFQAGLSHSGFDGTEVGFLAPFMPHLQRAAMLRWRFQKLSRQAHLGNFLLDRFHTPIMVVDGDGRVVLSNDSAESWLVDARSHFTKKADISLQLMSIAKKICDKDNAVPVAGVKCRIGNERNPSYLVGLPLKPDHPLACQWPRPVGVIIVQQTTSKIMPWAELFRELFGLSPAEARLLECLPEHDSLYSAALTLGVSKETARSHLKAIFQKTGVNKQAALSRLIVQLSQLH